MHDVDHFADWFNPVNQGGGGRARNTGICVVPASLCPGALLGSVAQAVVTCPRAFVSHSALQVPELSPRVVVLLKRALYDNDDEVGCLSV
jgi:hypothetical protein